MPAHFTPRGQVGICVLALGNALTEVNQIANATNNALLFTVKTPY